MLGMLHIPNLEYDVSQTNLKVAYSKQKMISLSKKYSFIFKIIISNSKPKIFASNYFKCKSLKPLQNTCAKIQNKN